MSAAVSVSSVARTRLSTCSTEVALAIGAVTPGLAMTQASATSAGLALWPRGDRVERVEDAKSARIEIGLDAAAARALREIGLAAVFAREEPLGEAEIGDDADLLAHAEIGKAAFEFADGRRDCIPAAEPRSAAAPWPWTPRARPRASLGAEVRGAAPADLALRRSGADRRRASPRTASPCPASARDKGRSRRSAAA